MTKQEFLAMNLGKGLVLQSPYGFRPNGKESTGILGFAYLTGDLYADIENKTFPAEFIPICRPFSDLTKPIEHKGEKFVPIERLFFLEGSQVKFMYKEKDSIHKYNRIVAFGNGVEILPLDYNLIRYKELQKLIEWHFDVADLISKGEAIDVNTLETNPYK